MYKKITAILLVMVLTLSMAFTAVYANEGQSSNVVLKLGDQGTTIKVFAPLAYKDKKDSNDKNKKDIKLEDILKKFFDSDEFEWAEKSIEKMGALGILSGKGDGKFWPKSNVTHAEAIAMVLNLTGNQKKAAAIKTEPGYFKGQCDPWSYGYLQLALDMGIIIPDEDGKFNPKTPAQRHEIAKYVVRAMGQRELALQNMDANLGFKDASAIPKNSRGYIYVISKLGIMQGSNNQFQPNKPITRAEIAIILDKAEEKMDTPIGNSSTGTGTIVAFDLASLKLTLKVNNKDVVYTVNQNSPVYVGTTYYTLNYLKPGDLVKVITDQNGVVIFVEFKEATPTVPAGTKLSIQTVGYDSLPLSLKAKVDTLKLTQNYAAFRYNNDIYLIATRGQMPTGGYGIDIKEVYKETVQTNKYDIKAVVEVTNPGTAVVTQAITYPYEVVKLSYFDGIEKIKFVDPNNTVLSQTAISAVDNMEVINGKVYLTDTANRIIYYYENNNFKSITVPTNTQITIGSQAVELSALTKDMNIAITKVNGTITSIAGEYVAPETITGKIDAVNTTTRVISVLGTNGRITNYTIPAAAQITLNNQATTLSSLIKDMTVTITKTNNVITSVAAVNTVEAIVGIIDSVNASTRVINVLGSNGRITSYTIPAEAQITLNNQAVAITALIKDMPITITKTNSIITSIAVTSAVETLNGRIDAVDAANRTIRVILNNGAINTYAIPTDVQITLNNQAVALTALIKDMPIVITRTNGIITAIAVSNVTNTISGKIEAVDTTNKTIAVRETNNAVNTYLIPTEITVTLNGQASNLTALAKDMPITITRVNGVITAVAVTNTIETKSGTIYAVNVADRVVRLQDSTSITAYTIPATAEITLDNQASTLTAYAKDMSAVITITNGVITKIAAQNNVQNIEGVLITNYTSNNKTYISVKVGNVFNTYEITASTAVFYNNNSTTIQNIPLNSTITVKIVNGFVTEVRNK